MSTRLAPVKEIFLCTPIEHAVQHLNFLHSGHKANKAYNSPCMEYILNQGHCTDRLYRRILDSGKGLFYQNRVTCLEEIQYIDR